MVILSIFLSALAAVAPAFAIQDAPPAAQDCRDWQACRDQARAAADRQDFEQFHDLAWRAVQKGPKNDPALMTLLARAQSLSGRPHDALVMLLRLAAMGVVTDAAASEDFRRVRALAGWTDLERAIAGIARPITPEAAATAEGATSEPKTPSRTAEAAAKPEPPAARPAETPTAGDVDDALRFTTVPFTPAGLAYDAVSKRFILGDRFEQKLTVIGEGSQRLANLTGAESGGFGQIEAIAIDVREGDLWVASAVGDPATGRLHKLQLISGRLLQTAPLPELEDAARLTDLVMSPDGSLLALDSAGRRLFRIKARGAQVELLKALDLPNPVSIAPAPGSIVFAATSEGLARIGPNGESASAVTAPASASVSGLEWIRWHEGTLVGIRRRTGGLRDIVRIRLDRAGRTVTRVDVLEREVSMTDPAAATLTGKTLYYLARDSGYSATGGMDVRIRRLRLR
jgi:hypothetical protein